MLDVDHLPAAVLGFHAQQAAEKLLKALLIEVGVAPPYIHDLDALVLLVNAHDQVVPAPTTLLWSELSPFGVRHRYGDLPPATALDPADLRAAVDGLQKHVEARVQALAALKQPPPSGRRKP